MYMYICYATMAFTLKIDICLYQHIERWRSCT